MFNNNLKRNRAKHEKCNTAIAQISMASAARPGALSLWPSNVGGGSHEFSAARPAQANIHRWSHRHNHTLWIYLTTL